MKKICKMFYLFVGCFIIMACISPNNVNAAVKAKNVLSKAIKKMQNSTCISYGYDRIRHIDKSDDTHRYGTMISDNRTDYATFFDLDDNSKAWVSYRFDGKDCRKSWISNTYTTYYDANDSYSWKNKLQWELSNLKNVKFKSKKGDNYVITATSNQDEPRFKKITITINKKSGEIVGIEYSLAKVTYQYYTGGSYTITGGTEKFFNICYGSNEVEIPEELQ